MASRARVTTKYVKALYGIGEKHEGRILDEVVSTSRAGRRSSSDVVVAGSAYGAADVRRRHARMVARRAQARGSFVAVSTTLRRKGCRAADDDEASASRTSPSSLQSPAALRFNRFRGSTDSHPEPVRRGSASTNGLAKG